MAGHEFDPPYGNWRVDEGIVLDRFQKTPHSMPIELRKLPRYLPVYTLNFSLIQTRYPGSYHVAVYFRSETLPSLDQDLVDFQLPPLPLLTSVASVAQSGRFAEYQPGSLKTPSWPDWIDPSVLGAMKTVNFPYSVTSGAIWQGKYFAIVERLPRPYGANTQELRRVRWAWGK